jgi:hypothetical protein
MSTTEILKDKRKEEDWKRTEPEIKLQLINDAVSQGAVFNSKITELRNEIKEIVQNYDFLKKFYHNQVDPVKMYEIVAGLDGSNILTGMRGVIQFICASTASIVFQGGLSNAKSFYNAKIIPIKDDKPEIVKHNVQINSMRFEVENLEHAINDLAQISDKEKLILIDGPIIDPPNERDEKYIKERCNVINSGLENNILIVGVVKRFYENFFLKFLREKEYLIEENKEKIDQLFRSDTILASFLFSNYNPHRGECIYTEIFEFDNDSEIYFYYKRYGLKIYSFLFQFEIGAKIYRLDLAVPYEMQIDQIVNLQERIIQNLIYWTYEKLSYPFPVVIAHEKCTLKKSVGDVLFQEYISSNRGTLSCKF